MKRTLLASTMVAAILGAAALGVSAIAAPTVTTSVPERADNFQLTDHTRLAHELHYFRDAKAIVMMSQINGTSVSRKAAAELEKKTTDHWSYQPVVKPAVPTSDHGNPIDTFIERLKKAKA